MVPDMTLAAIAAGADGVILEVHPDPERAMSDGYQSLNFQQFAETMDTLSTRGALRSTSSI